MQQETMNFWPLILLFGTGFLHWTISTPVPNVIYDLSNGILRNVTSTDSRSINLSHLHIEFLFDNCFNTIEKVVSLDLSNNDLVDFPPAIFSKLVDLKNLSLSNNKISSFNTTFVGLINLEYLDISQNSISFLKRGDLFGLPKTVKIIVEGTGLCEISTGIFRDPSVSILIENEEIVLNENFETDLLFDTYTRKICITPDHILEFIEEAKPNDDVGNCILQSHLESRSTRKPVIFLGHYGISGFKHNWNSVKDPFYNEIDFSQNVIEDLSPELINNLLPTIKTIHLDFNLITEIKNNGIENNNSISIHLRGNLISTIEDGAFGKLNLNILGLEENNLCSTSFSSTLPKTIRHLRLDYNEIAEVPLNSFYGLKNLESLSMNYMQVENIEPGTFRDQENLLYLGLSGNEIDTLEPGFFQGLDRLEIIDLSSNKIKEIPSNLFEGWNPSTKFSLLLDHNKIDTIENRAFFHMNLSKLELSYNHFQDDSIGKGSFNGSVISELYLGSSALTKFNGEWFRDVSGLEKIHLSSPSVTGLEKGFAKYMKNVTTLYLEFSDLQILQNGALFGLSTEKEVTVELDPYGLKVIEGGLFDDL